LAALSCRQQKPSALSARNVEKRASIAAAAPQIIEKWIVSLSGWNEKGYGTPFAAPVVAIEDQRIAAVFPAHLFYVVHYEEWPVGRGVPAPLTSRNVFVLGLDATLTHATDAQTLEEFFRRTIARPPFRGTVDQKTLRTNQVRSRQVIYAWLRLSQEFSQDGGFEFSTPEDSIVIEPMPGGYAGLGKAVVVPRGGNLGEVSVIIRFRRNGEVETISECRNVLPGERPVCQATKLLDRDPIVRRMAEQSLLVMGRAFEPYIMDQRAKASPELRREIDRVWTRIVTEGR
jgi:hypothetical protein